MNHKKLRRLYRDEGLAVNQHSPPGTSDLPVSAEKPGDRAAQSGLVRRHHLHPDLRPLAPSLIRGVLVLLLRSHSLDHPDLEFPGFCCAPILWTIRT